MFSEYEMEKGAWYWAGKCAFQKPSSKELSELLAPKVEIEDKIETTLSSGSIVLFCFVLFFKKGGYKKTEFVCSLSGFQQSKVYMNIYIGTHSFSLFCCHCV